MSFFRWGPKPSVAEQRKLAEKKIARLQKKGHGLSPVVIEGRTIASSFWGKSWCNNLESYSDYANRLPRGRSYVRHSCVIDLLIGKGEIKAQVNGSSLYEIRIAIAPLGPKTWTGICHDCSSSIDSMVELLQGRLSKAVMDRVCRMGDGLFPSPKEIKLSCSCPDGASMCKHVAAALYGVGARLDRLPELLFVLRGVDQQELIAKAGAAPAAAVGKVSSKSKRVLADDDLASVFGLDMATATPEVVALRAPGNVDIVTSVPRKAGASRKTGTAEKAPRQAGRKRRASASGAGKKAAAKHARASGAGKRPISSPRRKNHNAISKT